MTSESNERRQSPLGTGVPGESATGDWSENEAERLYGGPVPVQTEGEADFATGGVTAERSYSTPGTDTPGSGLGQQAGAAAGEVKDVAAAKAVEVKDEALQRGSEVAAVAKEELANVLGEFRGQVQHLWGEASGQLREQARSGQQQLADLLHSLSGELGHLAARSEQDGPLTAFARSAAARGGEWSHWLANTEPSDVLAELRRFARRRPMLFLTGAAVAGVVVGRLSRGLMASSSSTPTRVVPSRPAVTPDLPGPAGAGTSYPAAVPGVGTAGVPGTGPAGVVGSQPTDLPSGPVGGTTRDPITGREL